MSGLTKKPRLAGLWSRFLAVFCIALTLSFGVSAAVSASESAHHELEVAKAASPGGTIICVGDDRSCGLPDHDENNVVPHLHTSDIGLIGLPVVDAPVTVRRLATESVPFPACLVVDGLKQPTPPNARQEPPASSAAGALAPADRFERRPRAASVIG
jgi:hypothetical protein